MPHGDSGGRIRSAKTSRPGRGTELTRNMRAPCDAPALRYLAQYVRAGFQGSSYGPLLVRRQMAPQWAEGQSKLAFALADFTFFMGYMRPRLQRVDGPHAPGERSNGLNATYVISKQSLYRPDLLLTFEVYTAHTEGPFRARMYFTGGRQILRGNSVDASNPLRASLQVHIALAACKTRGCHGFSSDLVSRIVMS